MDSHVISADLVAGQEYVETPHGTFKLTERIVYSGKYEVAFVDADQFATAVAIPANLAEKNACGIVADKIRQEAT
jgi:hypothetical protein